MIRIIDATLTMLDSYMISKKQILKMLELLKTLSITSAVISPLIYDTLEGNLPSEMIFYMKLNRRQEKEEFKGIQYYISNYHHHKTGCIQNYQINITAELSILNQITHNEQIMITGMDELLLYENMDSYEDMIEQLIQRSVILYPENSLYCASAIAFNYLQRNKKGIVMTTFGGIGNKAATEQVLMAMHIGERYKPNLTFEALTELRLLFEEMTGKKMPENAAVVGEKIFYVESGVHVDGILKKPSNYEPFSPELVGAERKIILGKHSGIVSIKYKIRQMQLKGEYRYDLMLERIKRKSIKIRRGITDEEFLIIAKECEYIEKENEASGHNTP